jgi:hypothetical protein
LDFVVHPYWDFWVNANTHVERKQPLSTETRNDTCNCCDCLYIINAIPLMKARQAPWFIPARYSSFTTMFGDRKSLIQHNIEPQRSNSIWLCNEIQNTGLPSMVIQNNGITLWIESISSTLSCTQHISLPDSARIQKCSRNCFS